MLPSAFGVGIQLPSILIRILIFSRYHIRYCVYLLSVEEGVNEKQRLLVALDHAVLYSVVISPRNS